MQVDETRAFGDYDLHMRAAGHLVISRADGRPAEPGWWQLQLMARIAWDNAALAIEIFPPAEEVIDGQNQRHLWLVPEDLVEGFPSLYDGRRWGLVAQ